MRKLMLLSCLLCHLVAASAQDSKDELLYSFTVFRDGDSTPAKEDFRYSTDPEELAKHVQEYGYNQLIPYGMRRSCVLGWYLGVTYGDLFGRKYNGSNVYIRSIDSDSYKMSTLTTLHGLYPAVKKWLIETNWTPVPYTTVPKEYDFNTPLENCPYIKKVFKERRERFYPEMLKHKDILDLATKDTQVGFNVTEKPLYIIDIFYTIQAEVSLGLHSELSDEKSFYLFNAADDAYTLLYDGDKYNSYIAGVLFNEFIKDLDKIAAGEDVSQRAKVYAAGPDVLQTITNMMRHSVESSGSTQFSQAFTMEVKRENETGKIYVVPKVAIAIPLDLHGTGFVLSSAYIMQGCKEGEKELCYYDQFVKLTRKDAWDFDTWKAKCHANAEFE